MTATQAKPTPVHQLQDMLGGRMERVNALIRQRMASEHAPRIPEVTAHLVEAGGKRLRPLLTLAAAHACDYGGDADLSLAAAVEFIHTATLLHDDVVDKSAQRRGRPTANLLWDNKSSVLVGDYLFARSFQLMVDTGSMRVMDILANASAQIAEGEVLQLTTEGNLSTDMDTYIKVVRGKTAVLFAAACEVGAVIADASDAQVQGFADYGDALGISFQVTDDLLDYGGVAATFGKDLGDDFREGKMTLPVILSIARADAQEHRFWQRVMGKVDQQDGDLEQAMTIMARHGSLEETREVALSYAAKARDALTRVPDGPIRATLADLSEFVVARLS